MNISRSHKVGQTRSQMVASYTGIFFVLFFVLLVGCVKVSVSCKVDNIDEIASAVEDCKEQPNMAISKEF
jgi:hypothetical protein